MSNSKTKCTPEVKEEVDKLLKEYGPLNRMLKHDGERDGRNKGYQQQLEALDKKYDEIGHCATPFRRFEKSMGLTGL